MSFLEPPAVLLDTCAFIWAVMDPDKLSAAARFVCEAPDFRIKLSPVSLAEILIKVNKGRLPKQMDAAWFFKRAEELQAEYIPITMRHVAESTALPPIHDDPFDRLLIATAIRENCRIVTSDAAIRDYPGVEFVW